MYFRLYFLYNDISWNYCQGAFPRQQIFDTYEKAEKCFDELAAQKKDNPEDWGSIQLLEKDYSETQENSYPELKVGQSYSTQDLEEIIGVNLETGKVKSN